MEKESLSQQTAQRLYTMIVVEKRIGPGEKLPNEMVLSQQLGVSRTTLREAIRALTTQGILMVRRGRGTFVSDQVGNINDFGFSGLDRMRGQLRDLFELRMIFEPSAARLACRRATESELSEILACGAEVERRIRAGRDRTEADREFHAAIVRATHNEFMVRLLPIINQAVASAIVSGGHADQLADDTRKDHALLLEFFRRRDESGAEHAMAIHMHHSIDVLELKRDD
ncbi:MAG: FadR family transcriptional regulator [Intestinimonas sp.]|jgi:DNA-binding FadR family transcriptional regulator|nr:FadR family transcriptional regulator [Intestinimonas sp.]